MAKKKSENNWLDALQKIGVVLAILIPICGVIMWFYERELTMKEGHITQLEIFKVDNVSSMFEAQKKIYSEQLALLEQKIKILESSEGQNSEQIKIYKQQVIELQTKINIIKDLSNEVVKAAEVKLGPNLKYTEIVPFSFYKFPDERNTYIDSLFRNTLKIYDERYESWRKVGYYNEFLSINPYMLRGQHSPMFYSFDSVDLRTATFRNTDLRGVDLSKSIFDSKTKFPKVKR